MSTFGVWNVTRGFWATALPMTEEEAKAWLTRPAQKRWFAYLRKNHNEPDDYEVRKKTNDLPK